MALEALSIIDIDTSQPFLSVVHAKQYDSVRKIEAHLFFSGAKWYVPANNIYAVVSYKKSDHVGGFYDVTEDNLMAVVPSSTDRSIIYIYLDRNMLTKPGQARTEVIFFDTLTGGQLGSFAFIIEIEETSITAADMSSSPYFALLARQIQAVLKADNRVSNLQASAVKLKPAADPTAEVEIVDEGTDDEAYNIKLGIPSMPSITASTEKLAPNATPTATVTGGTTAGQAYNIKLGIPSMPAITASTEKLAPNATPTATVSGGTTAGQAYNIKLGIPSMPSVTTSAEKLAPNATPTATITGGTTAGQAYNIKLGIPSMPSITASAETVSTTTAPTVTVSGGASAGQAYNFNFKLPRNGTLTPKSTAHRYAIGTNNQDVPTAGWVNSVSELGGSSAVQGKYVWVENKLTWTDDYVETFYLPMYNGLDGDISIDTTLSTSSENPIANKTITTKVGTTDLTTTKKNLSEAVNELNGKVLPSGGTAGLVLRKASVTDYDATWARAALHISVTSFSSLPQTITNAAITADMRVVNCVYGTPASITGDISWSTANGSLTLSGSISGSTTAEIDLVLF